MVVADPATLGRPAVAVIATEGQFVVPVQLGIEVVMPATLTFAEVSVLCPGSEAGAAGGRDHADDDFRAARSLGARPFGARSHGVDLMPRMLE
jgi:hypothetical protein